MVLPLQLKPLLNSCRDDRRLPAGCPSCARWQINFKFSCNQRPAPAITLSSVESDSLSDSDSLRLTATHNDKKFPLPRGALPLLSTHNPLCIPVRVWGKPGHRAKELGGRSVINWRGTSLVANSAIQGFNRTPGFRLVRHLDIFVNRIGAVGLGRHKGPLRIIGIDKRHRFGHGAAVGRQ